ncbi:unnamed protein product [Effrenium voratum]|nr:unnamed protein product [Effrenium voratum]
MDDSLLGRSHMKQVLADKPNTFVVSLGDLGESSDCTDTKQLFSGTTPCFRLAREYLDGVGFPFEVVGGNHDLEGIEEFGTDADNLAAFLDHMGKESPQFSYEVAEKTLLVGLGSTSFRSARHSSHEVSIDAAQLRWFEEIIHAHPASEGWQVFVFSHAPILGSSLRVVQEVHVVNGCCWLNHTDATSSRKFIQIVRENECIKGWFSGHFHLSHDYEDSITFPGGNRRGNCVFAQTGVMRRQSSRDGRRQSRLVRGNSQGYQVYTVDHKRDGELRLDATVLYSDVCEIPEDLSLDFEPSECSTITFAHKHEDFDHNLWLAAYVPKEDDGCVVEAMGSLNDDLDFSKGVCWWHMKDGAILGVHNGMVLEYDASTLAPLGMVISRDELRNRRVAVIDDECNVDAMSAADALQTLGLTAGCDEQDVTQAFRRLARQRHPDKGGSKEEFQRLRAAYELLVAGGLPVATSSAPRARRPEAPDNPFARMWAEAQRLSAQERAARQAQAARKASMSGAERAQEEGRRRKRERDEEEKKFAEEWETLRQEQAQQRAAHAARFQQRRNKWAAQHRAHISGVSYDMQAEAQELRRWLRLLQQSRLPREPPRARTAASDEPPIKMARVLRGRSSR